MSCELFRRTAKSTQSDALHTQGPCLGFGHLATRLGLCALRAGFEVNSIRRAPLLDTLAYMHIAGFEVNSIRRAPLLETLGYMHIILGSCVQQVHDAYDGQAGGGHHRIGI